MFVNTFILLSFNIGSNTNDNFNCLFRHVEYSIITNKFYDYYYKIFLFQKLSNKYLNFNS